jgi:hypothetical protein
LAAHLGDFDRELASARGQSDPTVIPEGPSRPPSRGEVETLVRSLYPYRLAWRTEPADSSAAAEIEQGLRQQSRRSSVGCGTGMRTRRSPRNGSSITWRPRTGGLRQMAAARGSARFA